MNVRLLGLAAVTLAAISACTAGLRVPTSPALKAATTPTVATLPQAWSAQHGTLWSSSRPVSPAPAFWTTATSFIVAGTQSLTSYSAQTGAKQWSLKLPEPLCTIAQGPNATGIGAVMMGSDGLAGTGGCGRAGAVDTLTGRLLWTTSLKGLSYYGLVDVAAGPSAVVATSSCDRAVTMAIRTGRILVKLPAKIGTDCLNSWTSDGTTLVDGQKFSPHGGLVGYDVVSGRRLWATRSQADAAHRSALNQVTRVISSDPLVVIASINQHNFLRTINPKAGTATAFGREGSDSWVSAFEPISHQRLAVQYAESGALFTYDPGTGRQTGRVVLNTNERVAGRRGGAVITVSSGDTTIRGGNLVVRSTDVATGVQRVLGVVKGDEVTGLFGVNSVSGNTLVVEANGALGGYHLPTTGPLESSFPDPVHWAAGDVKTKQAVDLCTGITAATTRAFGFLPPTHAAPADCGWVESTSPNQIVQLRVQSNVSIPVGTTTAVEDAHRLVMRLAQPNGATKSAMTPLAGLGDEAVTSSRTTPDPNVTIVVRRANVVATLYATSDSYGLNHKNEIAVLQHALRLAAQDVVAEIDRRH